MKAGDLVRFTHNLTRYHIQSCPEDTLIGLLIEYHTWEKIGTILYKGKTFRIHADYIQKAGKKDYGITRVSDGN